VANPSGARRRVRIIGGGRAGRSFALALTQTGWRVASVMSRGDDVASAAADVDLVLIATPDAAIEEVAALIEPRPETVIAHVAGSIGLEVLASHSRRGAVHPLVAMPTPDIGATRLVSGGWFAIAGDSITSEVVDDLGGRWFEVADSDRSAYHAAAVIASNHVVALLGQAERIAVSAGVPFAAYVELVRSTVDNVAQLGPAAALTGPAARGDWATIDRHLAALDPDERAAYQEMVRLARRLVPEA